jgi:hypothetical protein
MSGTNDRSSVNLRTSGDTRRAAIKEALTGSGMDAAVAERWCGAWEAEATLRGMQPGEDYWDAGKHWIDAQCSARKQPPN